MSIKTVYIEEANGGFIVKFSHEAKQSVLATSEDVAKHVKKLLDSETEDAPKLLTPA